MLIPVVYKNGKHDLVKDFVLDRLIENRAIMRFKRKTGWVDIISGRVRRRQRYNYDGPRRRSGEEDNMVLSKIANLY